MSTALRTRNTIILAKVESVEGEYEPMDPNTDAISVDDVTIAPQPDIQESTERRGGLDAGEPTIGATPWQITVTAPIKGPGPGNAGTSRVEVDPLLQCVGLNPHTQAAESAPVACEAAGGTTTTFDIDVGVNTDWDFPSSADAIGRPIMLEGTEALGATAIASYVKNGNIATVGIGHVAGNPIDAGTTVKLLAGDTYIPWSGAIPSISVDVFIDGIKYEFKGIRGNLDFTFTSGQKGTYNFTLTGVFHDKRDVPLPTAVYSSASAQTWRDGEGDIDRLCAAFQEVTVNLNNVLTQPDNPCQPEAIDATTITERDIQMTMNPLETLVATRNITELFRQGTPSLVTIEYGPESGNMVACTVQQAKYRGADVIDREGLSALDCPASCLGTNDAFGLALY